MASSHGTSHPDPNPDPDPHPDPNPQPDPNPIPTAIRYAAANGIVVLKPCQVARARASARFRVVFKGSGYN